ncbi:hypothetical protein C1645_876409 [Glomus cerebriforme]|uniref:Sel1 repeat protein n=1 Tax=Glomus cerebriforme TaxID=658196 RepID=A0A397SZ42_9GLOM|nr:hypothetical protein C1645_876409 [Glomus cerebriforme]
MIFLRKLREGINKNEKKAFEWYMKSAIGGYTEGQQLLGFCYECGIGTIKNEIKHLNDGKFVNKDETKAFEWYLKSAIEGNCYYYGKGTDKDETKALKWYMKSATARWDIVMKMKSAIEGYAEGRCNLGYCYVNGIAQNYIGNLYENREK